MAIFGVTQVGRYALGEIPSSEDLSTPVPFWAFLATEQVDRLYVLEVSPLPLTGAADTFWYPLGQYPLSYLTPADRVVPDVLRWSNKPLETAADDIPPSISIQPRLAQPINFRASIPLPGSTASGGSSAVGFVRVANPGDLDACFIGASWAGRDATIYIGGTINPGRADEVVLAYKEYNKLYSLQIGGITVNQGTVDIAVREPSYKLNRPIQSTNYVGDGSAYEGGEDIKGGYKPVALGYCWKIPAVFVGAGTSPDQYIYQYHHGAGASLTAVYDNGLPLTYSGDTTDLINQTVSSGNYYTDISRGLLKTGDEPDSEIVVDITGVGGTTISSILAYLAERAGIKYDGVSFNSFGNYDAGFFCDTGAVDYRTVFYELMRSCDGWYLFDRQGKIVIGEHTAIDSAPSVLTIDGRVEAATPEDIENGVIRRAPGPPPVWKLTLRYRPYGATATIDDEQNNEKLLERWRRFSKAYRRRHDFQKFKQDNTVDPGVVSDWANEFRRIEPIEVPTTKDYHRNAVEMERDTHLSDVNEAATLASAMVTRDSKLRGLYSFRTARNLFKLFPGDVITLYHDRYNLSAGKKGRITNIVDDAATAMTSLEVLINE